VCVCAVVCFVGVAAGASALSSRSRKATQQHRLTYIHNALNNDEKADEVVALIDRAGADGYTGIVLDAFFDRFTLEKDPFIARVRRVREACDRNGLDLIPHIVVAGYAGALLDQDIELATCVPVHADFALRDGRLEQVLDRSDRVTNGSFETYDNNRAKSARFHDAPGKASFIDTKARASGRASLRFEPLDDVGMRRVCFDVAVEPQRCYTVHCKVRVDPAAPPRQVQIMVLDSNGRVLGLKSLPLAKKAGWQTFEHAFNSPESPDVLVYVGAWHQADGRFWVDDVAVTETPLINLVRRSGTPLGVSDDTGTTYEEERDYRVTLERKRNVKFDNEPAILTVTENTRIAEGTTLRVAAYQVIPADRMQVGACLAAEALFDITRANVERMHDVFAPEHYFIGVDEWRCGGWCVDCQSRPTGEVVGRSVARVYDIVREVNDGAEVFVWSDMLDPNHNAHANYYLVRGDMAGSWDYLPEEIIVACWHYEKRAASLEHFSRLGLRTLVCAFYDAPTLDTTRHWLSASENVPGVTGIMYTTSQNIYSLLEEFARLVEQEANPRE
jgi:hypothetical protein